MKKKLLKYFLTGSGTLLSLPISIPLTVAFLAVVGAIFVVASPILIILGSITATGYLLDKITDKFKSKSNENNKLSWSFILSTILLSIVALIPGSLAYAIGLLTVGAILLPVISVGIPIVLLNELAKKMPIIFNKISSFFDRISSVFSKSPKDEAENPFTEHYDFNSHKSYSNNPYRYSNLNEHLDSPVGNQNPEEPMQSNRLFQPINDNNQPSPFVFPDIVSNFNLGGNAN